MGKGLDMARDEAPIHAAVMDDFKEQLLIVAMKRLADSQGRVVIPVVEVDDTSGDLLAFSIHDGAFHFEVRKKS